MTMFARFVTIKISSSTSTWNQEAGLRTRTSAFEVRAALLGHGRDFLFSLMIDKLLINYLLQMKIKLKRLANLFTAIQNQENQGRIATLFLEATNGAWRAGRRRRAQIAGYGCALKNRSAKCIDYGVLSLTISSSLHVRVRCNYQFLLKWSAIVHIRADAIFCINRSDFAENRHILASTLFNFYYPLTQIHVPSKPGNSHWRHIVTCKSTWWLWSCLDNPLLRFVARSSMIWFEARSVTHICYTLRFFLNAIDWSDADKTTCRNFRTCYQWIPKESFVWRVNFLFKLWKRIRMTLKFPGLFKC